MGNTPIVTLPHEQMAGRCTKGFLDILGIDDTIASNERFVFIAQVSHSKRLETTLSFFLCVDSIYAHASCPRRVPFFVQRAMGRIVSTDVHLFSFGFSSHIHVQTLARAFSNTVTMSILWCA